MASEQAHQVIALSRRMYPSGRWPAGVSGRAAGYADPQALSTALRGAGTLVLVSGDGPVAPVMARHHHVIRAARASGAGHIAALSGLDADPCSPLCYAASDGDTERLPARSGCLVSIARASTGSEFVTGFLARSRPERPGPARRRRRPGIAGRPR